MKYTRPRGTEDCYGAKQIKYKTLIDIISFVAKINGYTEIRTPIFESTELFARSVGESSDIVKKEFYEFNDKSNRSMVLRPEGTAGVIRAIVEEKLINKLPLPIKLFYSGPMFRYERPQSGRLRQFSQFGVECIGTDSVLDDIDLILFAESCLKAIGLKNYELRINCIGGFESREKWVRALQEYFEDYKKDLTEDSITRLKTNPLRILDDKIDGKKDFVLNAPKIEQFLSIKEREEFNFIKKCLEKIGIKFVEDHTLVRGLDYYTNLVFEFVSLSKNLSGQPTILGGGRYSRLVKEIGGPDTSCLGFATGLERLLIALEDEGVNLVRDENPCVVMAPICEQGKLSALGIQHILRSSGVSTITNFGTIKLSKHFSYAEKNNAKFVIIIGEEEINNDVVMIKNQKTMTQEKVKVSDVVDYIKGA